MYNSQSIDVLIEVVRFCCCCFNLLVSILLPVITIIHSVAHYWYFWCVKWGVAEQVGMKFLQFKISNVAPFLGEVPLLTINMWSCWLARMLFCSFHASIAGNLYHSLRCRCFTQAHKAQHATISTKTTTKAGLDICTNLIVILWQSWWLCYLSVL